MRAPLVLISAATAAIALAACGSEGISVPEDDPAHEGAVLFAERCSGCHTISAAGTQGSGDRELRVQGPDFDEREETVEDVLFAIRNGGFSGAIMPQNIVVGEEAEAVAAFVARYSGTDVEEPPSPEDGEQPMPEEETTTEPAPTEEEEEPPPSPAGDGEMVFVSTGCGSCHVLEAAGTTGTVGPDLDEALAGADEQFIREAIVDPSATIAEGFTDGVMPQDYGDQLSQMDLDALVELLAGSAAD